MNMFLLLFLLLLFYPFFSIFCTVLSTHSLRSIPGPFWTRFTKIWYFTRVWKGHFERDNIALHQKYGPVVRVSPDHYSIAGRAAVRTVYGTRSKFTKSAWYEAWKHPDPDRWTLFPDRDVKRHTETRKRFSNLYSMSSLLHYEEYVDRCADIFTQRLVEHAEQGKALDLGHWFQCYAFDVIGDVSFGQRFGFLDQGEDIEGTIAALQKLMSYSNLVGIYPEWHPRIFGLLGRFSWTGAGGRRYIMRFVEEKIKCHKTSNTRNDGSLETQNFLEKLILARDEDPEKVTDYHLFMMGLANVVAGSDTTAISLSSIIYHLLQNPEVLEKLQKEIAQFITQGRCTDRVAFKESQQMPYFQAVMKESMRMHSATGLPLWRVVPDGGAEIHGYYFPPGSVVGINTWVAHYDEKIFPDPETFRPERWSEAESHPELLKTMNEMQLAFGLGSRTCLGKHIAILEMSKLIPRILRDFEFTTCPGKWQTRNTFLVKPTNYIVHVKRRVAPVV